MVFMYDGVSNNTSRIIGNWFDRDGTCLLNWLPWSPELTPSSKSGLRLKSVHIRVIPGLGSFDRIKNQSECHTYKAIEEKRKNLDDGYFKPLI